MKKLFYTTLVCAALGSASVFADPGRWNRRGGGSSGELIDRLIRCEDEKRNLVTDYQNQIFQLQQQLANCGQNRPWSCTVTCNGSGNVGVGTGPTKGAAQQAAIQNMGVQCPYIFDCSQD